MSSEKDGENHVYDGCDDTDNMEGHNIKSSFQFPTLTIDCIANDASGLLGSNLYPNQDYIVSPPSNGIHLQPLSVPTRMHYQQMFSSAHPEPLQMFSSAHPEPLQMFSSAHPEPLPVPPWMHYQQMLQMFSCAYREPHPLPTGMHHHQMLQTPFDVHMKPLSVPPWGGYSHGIFAPVPNLGLAYPPQLEEYLRPDEGDIITTVTGSENQTAIQNHIWNDIWNEESSHAFDTYPGSSSKASKCPSEARRKRSRGSTYEANLCRRLRISHWLNALKELVPHPEGDVDGTNFLDVVIDYIQFCQNLIKEMARSRLGGDQLTSDSFIFLEGSGHYLVGEGMPSGPLEETIGKLFDFHPSAATDVLRSRGLVVMPMPSAEELDVQDILPGFSKIK